MLNIEDLVVQRINQLEQNNPGLNFRYGIDEGDYGLISISDGGEIIGFEFVESDLSWERPDALTQYRTLAGEGYYVGVIVPEDLFLPVSERIVSFLGEMDISILTYHSASLRPVSMAS